jgi:hypothetical protein
MEQLLIKMQWQFEFSIENPSHLFAHNPICMNESFTTLLYKKLELKII